MLNTDESISFASEQHPSSPIIIITLHNLTYTTRKGVAYEADYCPDLIYPLFCNVLPIMQAELLWI